MDDDYEIIDDDLDYILLFDEDKKSEPKNSTGCCVAIFLLLSSAVAGYLGLSELFLLS